MEVLRGSEGEEEEEEEWEEAEEGIEVEEVEEVEEEEEEEELSHELQQLAESELGETEQVRISGLAKMRTWLKSQPHIHNCRTDSNFLLRFLRMQKHRVDRSSSVLEKYLAMRMEHPHYFRQLDIRIPAVYELVHNGYLFALPDRDAEGRRVIFSVARNLDPTRHTNSDALKAHIITFEALLEEEEDQLRGFTYIFDCSGLSLSHLSIWSPAEVGRVFGICEKNLPMRHRDINLLMLPFPMWAVFEFCKTLLSDKIRKRFCTHSNISRMQEKLRSSSMLPQEYGGSVPLATMTSMWAEKLEEARPRLLELDSMTYSKPAPVVKTKERKSSFWNLLSSSYGPAES